MISNVSANINPVFSAFVFNQRNSKAKNVALVDEFSRKTIQLDVDRKPDITHGEAVEAFIKSGLPDVAIDRFDTNVNEVTVRDALKTILSHRGKYDAVNISKASYITYKELSKLVGCKITPKNLYEKKELIKDKFFKSNYPEVGYLKEINTYLEELIKSGTRVYIASGNQSKGALNLYTLANGAEIVGALKNNGKRAGFSTINSLVNRHEKGVFKVKKIKDENGQKGFDFTQDGKIDIYDKDTTSRFKFPLFWITGTSFAAPQALIKDLSKINS